MSQVSSFATVVATEIRTIGQSLNVSTSVSRNVEGAMRILTTVEFPQGAQSTELIYDRTNAHAYVNVPGGDWRRTSPEALVEIAGLDIREYQVNFFAELIPPEDPPWDVYTVRYLGREEVEGAETHHLGMTVDLQDLLSRLSQSQGDLILGTAGPLGRPARRAGGVHGSAALRSGSTTREYLGSLRPSSLEEGSSLQSGSRHPTSMARSPSCCPPSSKRACPSLSRRCRRGRLRPSTASTWGPCSSHSRMSRQSSPT